MQSAGNACAQLNYWQLHAMFDDVRRASASHTGSLATEVRHVGSLPHGSTGQLCVLLCGSKQRFNVRDELLIVILVVD